MRFLLGLAWLLAALWRSPRAGYHDLDGARRTRPTATHGRGPVDAVRRRCDAGPVGLTATEDGTVWVVSASAEHGRAHPGRVPTEPDLDRPRCRARRCARPRRTARSG